MSSDLPYVLASENIPQKECFVASARGKAAIVLKDSDVKDLPVLDSLIHFNLNSLFCVPQSYCAIRMPCHQVVAICVVLHYVYV